MTQLAYELMVLSDSEGLAILMPGCVDQIVELANVGSRDGDCECVGVKDKTQHCLNWSRGHILSSVQGQRALLNSCVWLAHDNKDSLKQGCEGHLHKAATDC